MSNIPVCVGVDLGGTKTALAVVDAEGKCLVRERFVTGAFSRWLDFRDDLAERIRQAVDRSGGKLRAVGVGAPNANARTGSVDRAPNLPWKGNLVLREPWEKEFGVPVVVSNDASAAAMGEMAFGAGREFRHFIVVTLGTGVGCGIVTEGRLVEGSDGRAGELGHVIVVAGGRPCRCGRGGCLEAYASARGLAESYRELSGARKELPPDTIGEFLVGEAERGDSNAQEVFRCTGEKLGFVLATVTALLAPEAVFLAGGLSQAGSWILDPVREAFDKEVLFVFRGDVKIDLSGLPAGDAGLLGAAALAWASLSVHKKTPPPAGGGGVSNFSI